MNLPLLKWFVWWKIFFEDGEWAIMEWKDSLGLRGCGFFHVKRLTKSSFKEGIGINFHS